MTGSLCTKQELHHKETDKLMVEAGGVSGMAISIPQQEEVICGHACS